jgi:hypothetical protein
MGGGLQGRPGGDLHAGQAMAIGGHHPHLSVPKLPEDPVQHRAALLVGHGERGVPDEGEEIAPIRHPSPIEGNLGEGGEIIGGKPIQLEMGPAAPQLDLITSGIHLNRFVGELPDDLLELLPREP